MEEKNKLLLVDDDTSALMELIGILKDDYEISTAKSAFAAIERARTFEPDLILLDVVMPEMSGFDAIESLQQLASTRDIPVVFVSGADDNSDERKGLELGAIDYIRKPYDEVIIKLRVKHHISMINKLRKANLSGGF